MIHKHNPAPAFAIVISLIGCGATGDVMESSASQVSWHPAPQMRPEASATTRPSAPAVETQPTDCWMDASASARRVNIAPFIKAEFRQLTERERQELGGYSGPGTLVVSKVGAWDKVRINDIVLELDGKPVSSTAHLTAFKEADAPVRIRIGRPRLEGVRGVDEIESVFVDPRAPVTAWKPRRRLALPEPYGHIMPVVDIDKNGTLDLVQFGHQTKHGVFLWVLDLITGCKVARIQIEPTKVGRETRPEDPAVFREFDDQLLLLQASEAAPHVGLSWINISERRTIVGRFSVGYSGVEFSLRNLADMDADGAPDHVVVEPNFVTGYSLVKRYATIYKSRYDTGDRRSMERIPHAAELLFSPTIVPRAEWKELMRLMNSYGNEHIPGGHPAEFTGFVADFLGDSRGEAVYCKNAIGSDDCEELAIASVPPRTDDQPISFPVDGTLLDDVRQLFVVDVDRDGSPEVLARHWNALVWYDIGQIRRVHVPSVDATPDGNKSEEAITRYVGREAEYLKNSITLLPSDRARR